MAFKLLTNLVGQTGPFEYYLGLNGAAYSVGQALILNPVTQRLSAATGVVVPEFICQQKHAAEATAVTPIPVIRVTEMQEFEVNVGAATPAAINIGSKVTIHDDASSVTDVTTNGIFTVSGNPKGTANVAVGDKITGYFRR